MILLKQKERRAPIIRHGKLLFVKKLNPLIFHTTLEVKEGTNFEYT